MEALVGGRSARPCGRRGHRGGASAGRARGQGGKDWKARDFVTKKGGKFGACALCIWGIFFINHFPAALTVAGLLCMFFLSSKEAGGLRNELWCCISHGRLKAKH